MGERVVADPFRPGAFRVMTGPTSQSWVDLNDPKSIDFEYVQRIVEVLGSTVLERPETERIRVVHLGGGGLTLPRYVEAVRPHTAQIVCEPDSALLAEVRQKLPLGRRSGIKVREIDGRRGIAAMPDDYTDALIVDAFEGHSVPADLASVEFFADTARVLRPEGVLLMNLADQGPFRWVKRCLAALRACYRHTLLSGEPAVLKGRRFGNLVVAAADEPLPVATLTRIAAGAPFPYRMMSGQEFERWLGGAEAFTDATATDSPGPASGHAWFS